MSCATELLHPANFCPVCGARLAAPVPDGSAATTPGGVTPSVTPVPAEPRTENVVYLTEEHGIQPGPPGRGAVPPNPHAYEYEGVEPPTQPTPAGPTPLRPGQPQATASEVEEIRARAARIAAQLPAADQPYASHGPLPAQEELVPPPRVGDNPFGDFFSDGPSAWLEDEDDEETIPLDRPRILGTLLAFGAIAMLVAAWAVWAHAMYQGAGGAEAGGFILLAILLWVWNLSLPRPKQHAWMLRRHEGVRRLVERRANPLRERTEGSLTMRREKSRYRAMRDERTRRINSLGEGAYRAFRRGQLPADLHAPAQRVMAIERQMLQQDQRIHGLQLERHRGGHGGDDAAVDAPDSGHREG
jgi:hypothetical protein